MELCLGTVQFGMDYGINSQKQPSLEESIEMLDYATQTGIRMIDTAYQYGTAEEVVGAFLRRKTIPRNKLRIFTKLRPNILDGCPAADWPALMKQNLCDSLKRLGTDYVDGYLLHSSRYIFQDEIVKDLAELKKQGSVRSVGVSVYEFEEAQEAAARKEIDAIQLPYSVFDQRLDKKGFFETPEARTKEIYSRSAFLQGLIVMEEERVPEYLSRAKPVIRKIKELCSAYRINRIELAMSFVKRQQAVTGLVFGVDNMQQLKEDITAFQKTIGSDIVHEIAGHFQNLESGLVMPSLWAPAR